MLREDAVKFVEENMKTIFAYALSRVSHKEDAEDLAGDIILAILESAEKIRDPDALFGYIWAIAANTYKKFMRKRARMSGSIAMDDNFDIAGDDDVEGTVIKSEETRILYRELSLLSREYRLCTIAYYFDGLSCAEIAERYDISLEMVKYYLYKTRKVLKEGISMEREFGEKSWRPAEFRFEYTYDGIYNKQFETLFSRKLPGNILLSAYYTPMTLREISVELGVAAPYLEDEIGLLESYGLISRLPSGKWETRLVIFTESYMDELCRYIEKTHGDTLRDIISVIRGKLPDLRALGFRGCDLPDDRIICAFLWRILLSAGWKYTNSRFPNYGDVKLYEGAYGVCYGYDFTPADDSPYKSGAMAGRHTVDGSLSLSFLNCGVIPHKNRFHKKEDENRFIDMIRSSKESPFVIASEKELVRADELLAAAACAADKMYASLSADAARLMRSHAPEGVAGDIERVITSSLFGTAIAILFSIAVKSGALALPDDDDTFPLVFYAIHG